MKTYIYVLKDPITLNIRYVGKTTCLKKRFKSHKCLKVSKGTYLAYWIESLRKKELMPIMEEIELVDGDGWKEKESYWIEFYNKEGCDLVNLTKGGEGCEGYRHTSESKKKMSLVQKNIKRTFIPTFKDKKHSEKSKLLMSIRQIGDKNHQYGKHLKEETKTKISEKLGKKIIINGVEYISLRKAALALNTDWSTFRYRYKNGLYK